MIKLSRSVRDFDALVIVTTSGVLALLFPRFIGAIIACATEKVNICLQNSFFSCRLVVHTQENNMNDIQSKVIELLASQLSRDGTKIKMTDRIIEDLGADSLDIVTMLMNLEDEYGMTIPDDDAMELKTVAELVQYLEKNKK